MGPHSCWPAYVMNLKRRCNAGWDPWCIWLKKGFKKKDKVMLQQAVLHICTVQLVAEAVHVPA